MVTQPTHKRLSSGLQSLAEASPDYELAPVGIASMHKQAEKLAEYGRNGDIYIIHAAEGETVIPMEVLNSNPQIKALLFNQMKEMGLDPQEFVVGNELNSINPDTGLPEFFFGSIFRSVKRAAKKIFKAVKKIAPIALPIALSAFGFAPLGIKAGSLMAGVLGGGLGSLAGGGSLKDAFKSALIAGGTSALMGGAKGAWNSGSMEGFGQGVSDSFANPMGAANAPSAGTQWDRLTKGNLKDFMLTAPENPTAVEVSGLQSNLTPDQIRANNKAFLDKYGDATVQANTKTIIPGEGGSRVPATNRLVERTKIDKAAKIAMETAKKDAPFYSYAYGGPKIDSSALLSAGGENLNNLSAAGIDYVDKILEPGAGINPGMIKTWGPTAAAATGVASLAGMWEPEEVIDPVRKDLEGFVEGDLSGPNQLYADNPNKYKIPTDPYQFPTYTPSQVRVPSTRLAGGAQIYSLSGQPLNQQLGIAAAGGGYVNKQPRNNELPQFAGYVEGPGTTTSDSIPGWLSDKEFVFNSKAVAGADPSGRGNHKAGASNLYNMMRNLQMRA